MKRIMVAAGVAAVLGALVIPGATANAGRGPQNGFTMAVYGDSPYGNTAKNDHWQLDHTPDFIANVNADADVSLVAHVGDIHSGKDFCSLGYDQAVYADWTAFADPVVYTPGDNEWSDCHKAAEGAQDPLTNLGYVRDTFFAKPGQTLGGGHMHVTSQATAYDPAHPEDAQFVENVMFEKKDVMFVTLNIPGGSNNDAAPWFGITPETSAQATERQQRTDADLRWLDRAFATATNAGDQSIVIISQADMWDLDGKTFGTPDYGELNLTKYDPFIQSIADHTLAFDKPVLLFEGDSHIYRSDNPLRAGAPCAFETGSCPDDGWANHPTLNTINVPDSLFHRVIVHGSTTPLEWLRLTIDGHANYPATDHTFGPFSWARVNTGLQP